METLGTDLGARIDGTNVRIDALDVRVETLGTDLGARIDGTNVRIAWRVDTMTTTLGKRIDTLSQNSETVAKELHDMRTEFGRQLESLESRWN